MSKNGKRSNQDKSVDSKNNEQGVPPALARIDSTDLISFLESNTFQNAIQSKIEENNKSRDKERAVPLLKKLSDWKYISGGIAIFALVFSFASESIFKPFARQVIHDYLDTSTVVSTAMADIEERLIKTIHMADRTVYATVAKFDVSEDNTGFEFTGTNCDLELARQKISKFVEACPRLVRTNANEDEIIRQSFSVFEGQTVHIDLYAHRRVMKLDLAENCTMSGEAGRSCVKAEELRSGGVLKGLELRLGDQPIELQATNNIHEETTADGSVFFRHFKGKYTIPKKDSDDSPKRIRLLDVVRPKGEKDIMQATLHVITHVTRNKNLEVPEMPQMADAGGN